MKEAFMWQTFYDFYRLVELDGIMGCAVIAWIIHGLSGGRWPWVKRVVYSTVVAGSYILLYILPQIISTQHGTRLPYFYSFGVELLVLSTTAHFLLRRGIAYKLVYITFCTSFVQIYKMVCMPLYEREYTIPRFTYSVWDVATNTGLLAALLLLYWLFRRFPLATTLHLPTFQLLPALYFPVGMFVCLLIANAVPAVFEYVLPIICAIVLTNLPVAYYYVALIIHSYEEQRKMTLQLARSDARLEKYRTTAEMQETLRKERHELKNRYFYIQTLVRQNKLDELEQYLETITKDDLTNLNQVDTGNVLLDYLLNHELREARQRKIPTVVEVVLSAQLALDEHALCTVLLNLLDNAIEASTCQPGALIRITVKTIPGYLVCIVANRTQQDVLAVNPELRTTKNDKTAHGCGTKIIAQTVRRCDGILNYSMEGDFFTAKVMLPLQ